MWTVLFYVNPPTIALALVLGLAGALFLAWRRPAMRAVTLCLAALYVLILAAAPLSSLSAIGESDRYVVWDPLVSFQDIGGVEQSEYFGAMLDDGRVVRYSPTEPTAAERAETAEMEAPNTEVLHVHEGPDGALVVTDTEGAPVDPGSEPGQTAVETIGQELEFLARQAEEGPWSLTGGLALQERVMNTLLFVPIGIAAFFAFSSWPARLLFGPALSLTIESTQWALAAGRSVDTGDLLVNGVGALIGTLIALMAVAIIGLFARRSRTRPSTLAEHGHP